MSMYHRTQECEESRAETSQEGSRKFPKKKAAAAFQSSTLARSRSAPLHSRSATSGIAIAETAARKVLWHGGSGVAHGVAAFSFGLDGLWHRVAGFVPHLVATLAGEAHDLAPKLMSLWQWVQSAAAAALPYVLGAAAVLLVVALVWFLGAVICDSTVWVCRALVLAVCFLARGLYYVGAAVALLLPPCAQCILHCCTVVTMRAPGAAGWFISRAAFEAAPALYFTILRAGGAVVATAVFCARPVAWALAAPVACLLGRSVDA